MQYYAVKKGHSTGVFDNWQDCQNAITGYSGSDFKGFLSKAEAEAYLEGKDLYDEKIKKDIEEGFVVAFTDGSYDKKKNLYSYGVVVINDKFQETELYNYGNNEKFLSSTNISGEVFGIMAAIDWCLSNGHEKIKIYHDYIGIIEWTSGKWKANAKIAEYFLHMMNNQYSGLIKVEFEKVPGHANIKYNEKADRLAAKALNRQKKLRLTDKTWFIIDYLKLSELEAIIESIKKEHSDMNISINTDDSLKKLFKLILGKDQLTITFFKDTDKTCVQGKQSVLFQEFASYIVEFATNIEPIFQNIYKIHIDKDKITEELKKFCPSLPANYPNTIIKWLRQSIINLSYNIDNCEDYAQYTLPALKALDAHIEFLFVNNGISLIEKRKQKIQQGERDSSRFYMFNKINPGVYKLCEDFSKEISNPQIVEHLEHCYNYYNKHRHSLFHTGNIIGNTTTARILANKKEANEIIMKCLSLINLMPN